MKINTFLVTICLCSLAAKAQYIKIPDSNAIWSVWDEKYAAMGDSIYNGKTYTRFEFSNDSIFTGGTHFALIYQDSTAQKVYVIPAGDSTEHLLYDFSLQAGDTITVAFYWYGWSTNNNGNNNNIEISSIDTIMVNGQPRRRWNLLKNFYPEEWIEGIGSSHGIFSPLGFIQTVDIPFPLLLCMQNDTTYEYQLAGSDCYAPEPTAMEENRILELNIYPNPAYEKLTISSSGNLNSFELFTFTGKPVLKGRLKSSGSTIDVSQLTSGIYFLRIENGHWQETQKIVISR